MSYQSDNLDLEILEVGDPADLTTVSDNFEKIDAVAGDIATVETSPTKTAHSAGEFLLYEGRLYKVTAAISAGGSLILGTNVQAAKIGSEIKALRDSVGGIKSAIFTATFSTPSAQTASVNTGIKRKAMIGLVIVKSDDFYFCPVCLSVYDEGMIECRRVSATNADTTTTARSINIQVFYLPYLNV